MKTMKAQVLTEPYHFELKEVPVPEINEVLRYLRF